MRRSILFSDGSIITYTGMHADIEAQSFVDHWNASHGRAKCSIVLKEGMVSGSLEKCPEPSLFFEKSKNACRDI